MSNYSIGKILAILALSIVIFYIIILIVLYIYFMYTRYVPPACSLTPTAYDPNSILKIPKIIHQTAPADKSKWNPIWNKCQYSWLKYFPAPEFTYKMWTDEDLDQLIINDFPWFYDTYKSYPKNIHRIDIARYFILYKHGGIYADMDYECFENFYDKLDLYKVNITESPLHTVEFIQNSLIMSPSNFPFWKISVK